MKGKSILLLVFIIALIGALSYFFFQDPLYIIKPGIKIENISVNSDWDRDGTNDIDDILEGARKEIYNRTKYKSAYYEGGYPPESEGVCTDVVWRALHNAGYDLKREMDEDIKINQKDYPGVNGKPDPNIDFRRVRNQQVFFRKYAKNLTMEVKPFDKDNLGEWQPGDIVVLKGIDHVAIVSDKRRKDGVPSIIHNSSTYPKEQNLLMKWYKQGRIIGHYRAISLDN
jgi:uncharacterized protein